MGFIKLTMYSNALKRSTSVAIFSPYSLLREAISVPFEELLGGDDGLPVLYLFHGGKDHYMEWPLNSSIFRLARQKALFLVMPTIDDQTSSSWHGDYLRFMGEELPRYLKALFPITGDRNKTFVAGYSYGGYFAYRLAMNYPDNYYAVGSFSSPVSVKEDLIILHSGELGRARPDEIDGTNRDVLGMARALKEKGHYIPKLYQTVGTEDFTYRFNVIARDAFREMGLNPVWEIGPGDHNFDFWDPASKKFINWLPLEDRYFEDHGHLAEFKAEVDSFDFSKEE